MDHAAYVVNIGDMLTWSNGILRSTRRTGLSTKAPSGSRCPIFVPPIHDTEIRPFPQLVGRGRPSRYEPFQAGAHLERMLLRDFPYLRRRRQALSAGVSPQMNPFEARLHRETQ